MRWASAALPVALALLTSLLLSACDTSVETPVAATTAAINVTPPVTIAPTVPISTGPGNLASDIRVGLMGSFTGPGGSASLALKRGAQMAVDDLNKEGGVNGRKIALIERDDKGNPTDGIANVTDLIEKEKVIAVFGTASTPVGLAQAPIVQKSKVPWLIPLASGTKITQEPGSPSYIFRVAMVDSAQSQLMVDFAAAHYNRIGLIYDDSTYGSLGRDDLEAHLKAANLTPVLVEPYKTASTPDDFKPLLAKLKEAAPDVIINWGMGTSAGNLKKAMKDLKEDLPMIGPWNLATPEFHAVANGLEAGTLVVQTFAVDTTVTWQLDFINRYKQQFKTDQLDFPSGVAQAYDAMRLMGLALKQPGAAEDRAKLRLALENSKPYAGLLKQYTNPFSNPFHEALTGQDYFLAVWRDGKLLRANTATGS
jgi:branched-chain amino acid transport system substrate-binding protein